MEGPFLSGKSLLFYLNSKIWYLNVGISGLNVIRIRDVILFFFGFTSFWQEFGMRTVTPPTHTSFNKSQVIRLLIHQSRAHRGHIQYEYLFQLFYNITSNEKKKTVHEKKKQQD